jgi:NADH:ubiquinone reductase (H+-translocating)
MSNAARKRIVILGGGFAGVYTAKYLEKALGRRDDFEITLVNKENYFVFQPMLPEVISGTIGLLDTVSPIRRLLPRTSLHVRDVEAIDLQNKTVTTSPGFRPHPHVIEYDYLVFALGNVTDFRGMPGLPEHALPFKNLADALYLRNHVIRALEEAAIEDHDMALRQQLLTFVVAGGGFSGVEVAAELNDFLRGVAKNYRSLDPHDIRVVLVHSQDRILPELPEELARFAQKILQKRGVELLLNVRLAAASGEEAILNDGTRIPTRTLVSSVPSSPHPIIDGLDLPKGKNGRLICNGQLEVENAPGLFAVGDCGQIPTPDGKVSPPTAQYATRQARVAAENIIADIRGGAKKTFAFNELGQMGALGHRSAVAQILGFKVSGFIAWFIWRTIYLMKLPGWGRRLKVGTSWALDLLLPAELVQLKLNTSMGITQEHFEPGEDVFHQGDLGDRIYMIVSGQAEVVREDNGAETILAQLGPGEYFGEMALLKQTTRGATVRCTAPMNTICLPKREFGLLTAYLPQVRQTLENVMEHRQQDNTQKSMKA